MLRKTCWSSVVTGRSLGRRAVVHGVDRQDVLRRAGDEDLVGTPEHLERQGGLADLDAGGPSPLDGELAGDAEEQAGLGRWCQHDAVDDDEDVAAGALAELAARVAEDRLDGALLLGAGEGDDVLGVGRRLQADDGRAFVARPRDDGELPARAAGRGCGAATTM